MQRDPTSPAPGPRSRGPDPSPVRRVGEAYLVASESDGRERLLLGLVGDAGAAVTVDVPDGTDVVWLEEPLLGSVRAVAEPFFRGAGRGARQRR